MSQTLYSIAAGSYNSLSIPATAVPDSCTSLTLELECSAWTSTSAKAAITFQISVDGGNTWQSFMSLSISGGATDRTGAALGTALASVGLPPVTGRQVKATVTVSTAVLVTSGVALLGS